MSLHAVGLTKHFPGGGTPAVDNVTFDAPDGKITTLLGPSGSGKSTVLRLIAGLELPDRGMLRLGDVDLASVAVQERGVGFVFQSYALFKHMTVRENITFGLAVRRMPRREQADRVAAMIELVQLQDLADRFPAQLSGGQRQRVAFARALAIEPRLLLLDEPFAALDARVRVELREWLRRLHDERHVTTILVTHDQAEAMELSEHVVVMHEGRVEQAGPPREVYERPASPFVASFVGGATLLKGRAQAGRAAVSTFNVAAPGAADGADVSAYVRPHDVRVTKPATDPATENDALGVKLARVERLTFLGGTVKLALTLPDGAPMTVHMPAAEVAAHGITEGDRVLVDLAEAKVFIGDYSI